MSLTLRAFITIGKIANECEFNHLEFLWGGHLARLMNETRHCTDYLIHDPKTSFVFLNISVMDCKTA